VLIVLLGRSGDLNMFKIGIFSQSAFSRSGMKQMLQNDDVTEFDSLAEARKAAAIFRSLVLLAHENDIAGEEADKQFDDERLRVVVLAPKFNLDRMLALLSRGVRGYQLETVSPAVLHTTLQLVAIGERSIPSTFVASIMRTPQTEEASSLSAKELVVVRCLAEGACNKEISRSMGITEATAKVHVKAIMRKLGLANRTQAAVWAVRNGLDRPLVQR